MLREDRGSFGEAVERREVGEPRGSAEELRQIKKASVSSGTLWVVELVGGRETPVTVREVPEGQGSSGELQWSLRSL